jgi:hypothetical protein
VICDCRGVDDAFCIAQMEVVVDTRRTAPRSAAAGPIGPKGSCDLAISPRGAALIAQRGPYPRFLMACLLRLIQRTFPGQRQLLWPSNRPEPGFGSLNGDGPGSQEMRVTRAFVSQAWKESGTHVTSLKYQVSSRSSVFAHTNVALTRHFAPAGDENRTRMARLKGRDRCARGRAPSRLRALSADPG